MNLRIEQKKENTIAIFDIDGTLRQAANPWLLLHTHLGTSEKGHKYYNDWVEGKLTDLEICKLDALLWKGFSKAKMLEIMNQNPIRKGAYNLINWFKNKGIACVGISSGLSFLNDVTANELGLDDVVSNDLLFEDEVCTGKILMHVDDYTKGTILTQILEKYEIQSGTIFSFGDGIADIDLFKLSTCSVAVFPRNDQVVKAATIAINSEPIDQIIDDLKGFLK